MDQYFAIMFEDIWYEQSLLSLLPLTDPDILKRSKFSDDGMNLKKKLALEKMFRQEV